jgi:hypothetical protein
LCIDGSGTESAVEFVNPWPGLAGFEMADMLRSVKPAGQHASPTRWMASSDWQRDGKIVGHNRRALQKGAAMEFEHSEKVRKLQERVEAFMAEHVYPNEENLFAQVSEGDRIAH